MYIDDSNLYKRGKASGWMTDYRKLYKWVAELNTIVSAKYIWGDQNMNQPNQSVKHWEKYFEKIGFKVTAKDLKKLKIQIQ